MGAYFALFSVLHSQLLRRRLVDACDGRDAYHLTFVRLLLTSASRYTVPEKRTFGEKLKEAIGGTATAKRVLIGVSQAILKTLP